MPGFGLSGLCFFVLFFSKYSRTPSDGPDAFAMMPSLWRFAQHSIWRPTAGLALLLVHCWPCASSGPLLALRFFWPAGLLAFYGPSSSLLWTCFGPSLGLFRTFFGSSSGLPRTCFGPSLDCALLAKPWPSGALAFFRFVGPSVTSAVCGTGDVYEALVEERGSLPEHAASRLEHFPLVREIASPGKVSWAWPGVSPGPESRVTPLLLRPQLPAGPFSRDTSHLNSKTIC